jgi:cation transport regulator ChaC
MLLSNSTEDSTLALSILENRDKTNEESERNVEVIHREIIKDNNVFPKVPCEVWVAMIGDRLLYVNRRNVFQSKGDCMNHVSRHLTSQIGTSGSINKYLDNYYKMLKQIFKGGKELRDHLVKNDIIQIKRIL